MTGCETLTRDPFGSIAKWQAWKPTFSSAQVGSTSFVFCHGITCSSEYSLRVIYINDSRRTFLATSVTTQPTGQILPILVISARGTGGLRRALKRNHLMDGCRAFPCIEMVLSNNARRAGQGPSLTCHDSTSLFLAGGRELSTTTSSTSLRFMRAWHSGGDPSAPSARWARCRRLTGRTG